jgi:hypothetical protein
MITTVSGIKLLRWFETIPYRIFLAIRRRSVEISRIAEAAGNGNGT